MEGLGWFLGSPSSVPYPGGLGEGVSECEAGGGGVCEALGGRGGGVALVVVLVEWFFSSLEFGTLPLEGLVMVFAADVMQVVSV